MSKDLYRVDLVCDNGKIIQIENVMGIYNSVNMDPSTEEKTEGGDKYIITHISCNLQIISSKLSDKEDFDLEKYADTLMNDYKTLVSIKIYKKEFSNETMDFEYKVINTIKLDGYKFYTIDTDYIQSEFGINYSKFYDKKEKVINEG